MRRNAARPQVSYPARNRLQAGFHSDWYSDRGVTFIEVLVVVGVVLLLLAMLFPGLSKVRELGRRVQCQNNLKQWGVAMQLYRDEHNDYLPMEGTTGATGHKFPYGWYNVLPPYLDAPAYRDVEGAGKDIREFPELHMWICPSKNLSAAYKSGTGKNQYHYGMNLLLDGVESQANDETLPKIASPFAKKPHAVLMFDIYPNSPRGTQADVGTSYHRGIGNVLFIDGSVRSFRDDEFVVDGNFKNAKPIWNHPHMYWGDLPKAK